MTLVLRPVSLSMISTHSNKYSSIDFSLSSISFSFVSNTTLLSSGETASRKFSILFETWLTYSCNSRIFEKLRLRAVEDLRSEQSIVDDDDNGVDDDVAGSGFVKSGFEESVFATSLIIFERRLIPFRMSKSISRSL